MSDFVLVPPSDYSTELLRLAPRFAESQAYAAMNDLERKSQELVFSAFAKFFEDCYANRAALEECLNAIEHFARLHDSAAQNLIVTEVFEELRHPQRSARLLLPASRSLYERWIGPIT